MFIGKLNTSPIVREYLELLERVAQNCGLIKRINTEAIKTQVKIIMFSKILNLFFVCRKYRKNIAYEEKININDVDLIKKPIPKVIPK